MKYYFDHNATSPMRDEAFQVIANPEYRRVVNPSSPHHYGRQAFQFLEDARDKIAAIIGAPSSSIFFNSGGSETNNTILYNYCTKSDSKKILISSGSHPSIEVTAKSLLENRPGIYAQLPLNKEGVVDLEYLSGFDQGSISLVSAPWAQNETGVIQPVSQLSALKKEGQFALHLDGAQILGRAQINLSKIDADYVTFSGHKFGGPRGIGFIYMADQEQITPLIKGGFQENETRAGTEDVLSAIALAETLEAVDKEVKANQLKWKKWRQKIINHLRANHINYILLGENQERIENTLSIILPNINTPILLMNLDMDEIAVATGSACSSGAMIGSKVVEEMGLNKGWKHSLLRISFGWTNNDEDILFLCNRLVYHLLKK